MFPGKTAQGSSQFLLLSLALFSFVFPRTVFLELRRPSGGRSWFFFRTPSSAACPPGAVTSAAARASARTSCSSGAASSSVLSPAGAYFSTGVLWADLFARFTAALLPELTLPCGQIGSDGYSSGLFRVTELTATYVSGSGSRGEGSVYCALCASDAAPKG